MRAGAAPGPMPKRDARRVDHLVMWKAYAFEVQPR